MSNSTTFDFSGARVLVTGGTSGIGNAIAHAFAAAGALVTITGTRAAASDYDTDLSPFTYCQCRMSEPPDIEAVAAGCAALDVLVNNAGQNLPGGRSEYEPDVFEETVAVNLFGAFRMATATRELLAASELDGGASIVNLGSMSSFFGIEMVPAYGAAKAGVVQLTKTLAVAWARHGIRVNAVAPGVVETNMTKPMLPFESLTAPLLARTPLGRFAEAGEIAPTVLFLASSAAAYVTGQTFAVDGGYSVAGLIAAMITPMITPADVDTFWHDGVVCLRGVLPRELLDAMAEPVEAAINGAQSANLSSLAGAPASSPRFVAGVDHWHHDPRMRDFATASPLPAIVAELLRSATVYLYEDSVLVKEPGAAAPTQWHQDLGYFHVDGTQLCTTWCPLDPADEDTGAMRFARGSHLRSETYRPNLFVTTDPIPGTEGEIVPDVDRGDFDIVAFALEPGDITVHHARTLHAAGPNRSAEQRRRAISVRYCGDDARMHIRPGAPVKAGQRELRDGDALGGEAHPQVWPPPWPPKLSARA